MSQLTDTRLTVLAVLLLAAAEIFMIRRINGTFYYSLDDAYIHLAISEQIHHLTYGLNPGEVSTPSSSLLWPFLLAPTAETALHLFTPLILTLAATLLSAVLLLRMLRPLFGPHRKWMIATSAVALLTCLNWVGVAFTGMEHSAHVVASLAVGLGLVEVCRGQSPSWWLYTGMVVGPLLRYEGLLITSAAAVILAWKGYRSGAVISTMAALTPLLVFSFVAVRHGLSPLPSSVLVKSAVVGGGVHGVLNALVNAAQAPLFALLAAVVAAHLLLRGRNTHTPELYFFLIAVIIGHAIMGRFGWFARYELYVYAATIPVALELERTTITRALRGDTAVRSLTAALLIFLAVTIPYLQATASTPLAARNIRLQQAQLAKFTSEYWHEPVAVNDIGIVGYEDPDYVLDLWGLANQDARIARIHEGGTDWMERLASQHGVTAAMIYVQPEWLAQVPTSWRPVARLSLDVPLVTAAYSEVTIFSTSATSTDRLIAALREFAPTLPAGATLEFERDGQSDATVAPR